MQGNLHVPFGAGDEERQGASSLLYRTGQRSHASGIISIAGQATSTPLHGRRPRAPRMEGDMDVAKIKRATFACLPLAYPAPLTRLFEK
jgi:hypothetical protein